MRLQKMVLYFFLWLVLHFQQHMKHQRRVEFFLEKLKAEELFYSHSSRVIFTGLEMFMLLLGHSDGAMMV